MLVAALRKPLKGLALAACGSSDGAARNAHPRGGAVARNARHLAQGHVCGRCRSFWSR